MMKLALPKELLLLIIILFLVIIYLVTVPVHQPTITKVPYTDDQQVILKKLFNYIHERRGWNSSMNDVTEETEGDGYFYVDEKETVVLSGYLRSQDGYCAVLHKYNRFLMTENCSLINKTVDRSRMTFQFTSMKFLKLMGKCVTQVDGDLYLDHCYDGHPGQIWDPPDKQNYIQSAERGFCIKVSTSYVRGTRHKIIIADDCWKGCITFRFRTVTWWVVDHPNQEPPQEDLDRLEEMQHQPWSERYCLRHDGGPMD